VQSGLVFNSICASVVLNEPFTRYSFVGTVLVTIGALLIGIFGSMTEPSHNLDQLLQLLVRRPFILWLIGTGLIILCVIAASWFLQRAWHRQTPRSRLWRGMCYGFISGILSAHCLLVAKSAVELLVRTVVDRLNQFNRWQSWIILLGLVFLALAQLWFLHRGLKLCSTSVLYPFVFCIYNIIAIIDGLIYFNQSSRLSAFQAGLIALGTVILLTGVLSLSWRLESHQPGATVSKRISQVRLPTPISALAPGMGMAHPSDTDGRSDEALSSDEAPFLATEPLEQDFDEEHGFSQLKMSDPSPNQGAAGQKRPSIDERTPLMRAPTAPPIHIRSKKSPQPSKENQLRPQKRRRMTINEEAGEIWDELNDRDEMRHRSSATGLTPSPQPSPRTRSKTLQLHRRASGSSKQNQSLTQTRRRSWWEGMLPSEGRSAKSSSYGTTGRGTRESAVSDGEETDESNALMSPGGRSTNSGAWFRLKWWRKRWKGGDGDRSDERGA
jgi:magnesium transporter